MWPAKQGIDLDVDNLYVKLALANDGPRMKRIRPAPMGRAFRYQRRLTHIVLSVAEREAAEGLVTKVEEPAAAPSQPRRRPKRRRRQRRRPKLKAEPKAEPKAEQAPSNQEEGRGGAGAKAKAGESKRPKEPKAEPKATKKKAGSRPEGF